MLGSFLWSKEAIADLDDCDISNRDFLEAVRALAFTIDNNVLRAVDYKNLGSEELGSVYESLLELHPELNVDVGAFELTTAAGHERKTTGSYYTPSSLVNCLLDSALEPVLDEAVKKDDPEQAILNLKVCDPATGSGHFLVAAAHRMAKRLAAIRTGDDEPSPEATSMALRDVISHCIYGVDMNPMAVELCKVNLWLEALEPGKPLSFLDHHIKCGNSLLGTTPALIEKGIPDDAFKPIEGDNKALCKEFKKQNKGERKGQAMLFYGTRPWDRLGNLPASILNLDDMPDDTVNDIDQKQKKYAEIINSTSYKFSHLLADTWSAAFVFPKTRDIDYPITEKIYREIETNPHNIALWMEEEITRLAKEYQFFHWHLEFPDVFRIPSDNEDSENEQMGWSGGFDCILGNPPWERIKLQEKEFFAERNPEIANAPNAARRRAMIAKLPETNPILFQEFQLAKRKAEGESHLVRNSDYYPLCGRGDINTYTIFAELKRNLINPTGRVGCIVPSGIATDDTTKFFFQSLMDNASLASLYDFENREKLFPAVDSRMKFCLLTMAGQKSKVSSEADFVYFSTNTSHLAEKNRHFTLTAEEIALLNPNTHTCPIFRSKADAELTKYTYRSIPVLIKEKYNSDGKVVGRMSPWDCEITRTFDMARFSQFSKSLYELIDESYTFNNGRLIKDDEWIPILESKTLWHFDHRYSTYDSVSQKEGLKGNTREILLAEKTNPDVFVVGRYWLPLSTVEKYTEFQPLRYWLAYRNITNTTNERTMVTAIIPKQSSDYSMRLIFGPKVNGINACLICANLASYNFDYVARQSMAGTNFSDYIMKQLPVIDLCVYENIPDFTRNKNMCGWIANRAVELSYTAWDLESFAKDCNYDAPPFVWDEERRFKIRAELDAAYFHLYLSTEKQWKEKGSKELLEYFPTPRAAVNYIMDTFPIVKRKDEAKFGSYRTKEVILEIYDKMAEAIKTGQPYQTILDPPPADPSVAHPPRDSVKVSVTEKINPIYTIGHSNTSVDKLISLLKQNKIQVLADVRSVPYSRHVPQANREAIERAVKAAGIKYLFMGDQLGGRPKDIKIKDEQGNLDYSKLALTERFREGMDRLLKGASQYYVCLMCSEEDPSRCHRSLLISRELDKLGVEIRHIRRDGHIETLGELEKQIPPAQEGLFSEK